MRTVFAAASMFVMCAPLTMFVTIRDTFDDPKKYPKPIQKNLEE